MAMASTSLASPKFINISPPIHSSIPRHSSLVFRPLIWKHKQSGGIKISQNCRNSKPGSIAAMSLDTFFGLSGDDRDNGGFSFLEDLEEKPKCPPGLHPYETMAVLRPEITEEERLALTQRYEEMIVAGGGMSVEVFNRGVVPLAYTIKRRVFSGRRVFYYDGIYLLFTYFTKPESPRAVELEMHKDDDIIRSSTFRVKE